MSKKKDDDEAKDEKERIATARAAADAAKARAAELDRVRASRAERAKKDPPPGSHVPIYRERKPHEQSLQADHPVLLLGCMCGHAIDATITDPQTRAFLYTQHLPDVVDILAASAPLNLDDDALGDALGETED